MAYSFKKQNNMYFLYEDNNLVSTPRGTIVSTCSEELARRLVRDANRYKGDYSRTETVLPFHYSLCDIRKQVPWDQLGDSKIWDHCSEGIYQDEFLMFRQCCPMRMPIAQYFSNAVPELMKKLPVHRKNLFLNFCAAFHSVMLMWYIMSDIINEHGDYEELKQSFLDDLAEYYEDNDFGKLTVKSRNYYSKVIDAVTFYWNLKEV